MKSLKKEISFDGSKFWLNEEVVGEVEEGVKFRQGYDKEFIDNEKEKCIGRIMKGEI